MDRVKERILYLVVRAFMEFVEVDTRAFVCISSEMYTKVVVQFQEYDIHCKEIFAKIPGFW